MVKNMNILELSNINKSFGNRHIIKNFSLSIPQKSVIALMGKSGAGKSTLLNMIGLLESVDSGVIKLKGKKLPSINSHKATLIRRNTINYLFQSYALINDMTVKENMYIAMEFRNLGKGKKDKLIKNTLEELEIGHLLNEKINTLSGGEQQRVALARCILKPGELILADEPTGSLDKEMASIVFKLIKNLRDKYEKTVIIVTHDIELGRQCDEIVQIKA